MDAAGPRGSGSPFMDDFELDAHSNSADLNFSDLKLAPTPMRREPKVGGSYNEEAWVDRPVFVKNDSTSLYTLQNTLLVLV